MADENEKEAVKNEEGQPQAESPTADQKAEESTQTSEEGGESSQEQSDISGSTEQEAELQNKPTRLDKRINKLRDKQKGISSVIGKLEAHKNQVRQPSGGFPQYKAEPLIKPEEFGTEIDPSELERRVDQRVQLKEEDIVRRAEQNALSRINYTRNIEDHLTDSESVKKQLDDSGESPEVEAYLTKQYEKLNSVYDPIQGVYIFVPQVKMSEIYSEFKSVSEKQATRAAAQLGGELAKQASERPLAPSSQGKSNEMTLEEMRKKMIKDPGSVAKYLAEKLPYSED